MLNDQASEAIILKSVYVFKKLQFGGPPLRLYRD
uniref:Uncharacterized protein n=1 Tax=Anguilla anguilla TaxID=7936 RepID=A0A0E9VDC7_ANGAN